jgi:hypothetical protein
MHVTIFNAENDVVIWNGAIEDADFPTMGTFNGVGNGMENALTEYSHFYFADNPTAGKLIILGGDSQTASGGVQPGQDTGAWIIKAMKNRNVDVLNTAVSGWTTQNVITNLTANVINQKSAVLDNWYYINIGTNDMGGADSATTIKARLDTIVSTVKSAGFKVIVSTISYDEFGNPETGRSKEYNDLIRASAQAGAYDGFIDLYQKWGDPIPRNKRVYDALHLTIQARKEIAEFILEEMGEL